MRRLLIIGATTAAALAIGGTALASSGPGRHDDRPSQVVVSSSPINDNPSRSVDDSPTDGSTASPSLTSSPDDSPTADGTASPSPTRTLDDHGGLRTTEPGDDHGGSGHGSDDPAGKHHAGSGHGSDDPAGDDHGGSGHGSDDRSGDDHGGSRHRR